MTPYRAVTLSAKVFIATLVLTFLWAFFSEAVAQEPPATTVIHVGPVASRQLDSLASVARETRRENAACLAAYAVRDTVLIVERIVAPHLPDSVLTDSMSIRSTEPLCPLGVPTIHSHVAYGGYAEPSDIDYQTSYIVGQWAMILSVQENGWHIVAYGINAPYRRRPVSP